jgi:hypothetical protein
MGQYTTRSTDWLSVSKRFGQLQLQLQQTCFVRNLDRKLVYQPLLEQAHVRLPLSFGAGTGFSFDLEECPSFRNVALFTENVCLG